MGSGSRCVILSGVRVRVGFGVRVGFRVCDLVRGQRVRVWFRVMVGVRVNVCDHCRGHGPEVG